MERLGKKLKNRREELVFTIKDIEAKTNIRAKYLDAIERGEYDVLPGEVFLKGFIKNYSESLGFDSADILKQYHAEKNNISCIPEDEIVTTTEKNIKETSKEIEEIINTLSNNIYVNEPTPQNKNDGKKSKINAYEKMPERKSSSGMKSILIVLLIVCVTGVAGYMLFAENGDSNKKVIETPVVTMAQPNTPTSSSTKETKVMENKPVETPKVPEVPTIPTTPTKPVEPSKPEAKPSAPAVEAKPENKTDDVNKATDVKKAVRVMANITESCWMNVVVDGKTAFTGTAKAGENKSWTANEVVTVHLGNAGGVNLTVNDQLIAKGKQGEVVTRTFNATK